MVSSQIWKLLRKLAIPTAVVAVVLIILLNARSVHSSIVGIGASLAYFVLVGFLFGEALLAEETRVFVRSMYGVFLVICLLVLVGLPITVFYTLNYMTWAATLCAPPAIVFIYAAVKSRKQTLSEDQGDAGEKVNASSYISPAYIIPLGLIAYAEFLIVNARSGWIQGTIWDVVSPSFFVLYFLAAFSVFVVILYSKTRYVSKMLLTMMFSLVSIGVSAVVLYPGDIGDPIGHLGLSNLLYYFGNFRTPLNLSLGPFHIYWMVKEKGLHVLTVLVARMFSIDVYWINAFITPVLWGIFVPFTAFRLVSFIVRKERVAVLAGFLSTFFLPFLIWGAASTANGLGYVFFFVSLLFSGLYLRSTESKTKAFMLALLLATVSGFVHPFTGIMSFAFLFLAFSLRIHMAMKIKSPRLASVVMFFSFFGCILILLAILGAQNAVYLYFAPSTVRETYAEGIIAFSPEKLLKADLWELIFGEFVDFSFKEVVMRAIVPILGILGFAYAVSKKREYERSFTLFLLLAFVVCLTDYLIMRYAMVHVPFGPARIWIMRDLIAISFMVVAVNGVVEFLEGGASGKSSIRLGFRGLKIKFSGKRLATGVLLGLSFSAFALSSVYQANSYSNTLHPTELEVEAVKYIDQVTDGRYVALSTSSWTSLIGRGFLGINNPLKYYVYGGFTNPSPSDMVEYMSDFQAGVAYYLVPSFRTGNFEEVIAYASRTFGLFDVLKNENGEIHIFYYKVAPLPQDHPNPDADAMAFYWDTPPAYNVQNGFARVSFSPLSNTLDVRDFYGDLYESIDLSEVLTGGGSLGNWESIEYLVNGSWVEWASTADIVYAPQIQFRLNFENESLNGLVEKSEPFVQLWSQGNSDLSFDLTLGDFSRLYIPGLVGGQTSYNVSSREYGLFYTLSRTDGVVLSPANERGIETSSLFLSDVVKYCNLTITKGYFSYDVYIHNNAEWDQWANIEMWIPDEIYLGMSPFVSYSLDEGETWTYTSGPIKTLGGISVNWVASMPRQRSEIPVKWTYSRGGAGGEYVLPYDFTDSGGGWNRLFFGFYLPAQDSVLVRIGASIYYIRPLKITYVFGDSDIGNMTENSIKYYNVGTSAYVGGLTLTASPSSLSVTEDETGKMNSVSVTIPSGTTFSLLFAKGNTIIDVDADGVPDFIEG